MAEGDDELIQIELKFGGKSNAISIARRATLKELYDAASACTKVEPESLKLISKGRSLYATAEGTLGSIGIGNRSKIMAIGRKGGAEEANPLVMEIAKYSKQVDKLAEKLTESQSEYDGIVKGFLPKDVMDDAKKKIYKKSLQVSEEMMQVLEKLDQIVIDAKDTVPRSRRKVLIKRIQNLLGEVDKLKSNTSYDNREST